MNDYMGESPIRDSGDSWPAASQVVSEREKREEKKSAKAKEWTGEKIIERMRE